MTTNDDLMKRLNEMMNQNKTDNNDLRKDVNERLKIMTEKIDTAKDEAIEKEKRNDIKMIGILKRLDSIEEKMESSKDKSAENEEERRRQKERTKTFKESVGLVDKVLDTAREKTWSEIVEESREKDEEKKEKEKQRMTKHWTKKVTIKNRSKKDTPEDSDKGEKSKNVERLVAEEEERDALRLDTPLHGEEDWSWEGSDLDWEGTIEKSEMEKKRKVERYRKKKMLEEKVAKKAKHMLGLGPIRRASVSYFQDLVGDLEDAKKMAIDEYLSEYLQLNEEERKDFDIVDTTFAKNDDNMIYVTFRDFESVKEIRRRVAIIKNDEIQVRIFIPPQYWERYRFLSKYCAEERSKNTNLKTMIRFTDCDMEVLFKDRNTDEQYNVVDLKDIAKEVGKIPRFDHSVQWKLRVDRPLKTTPKVTTQAVRPPSLGGARMTKQSSTSSSSSSGPSQPSKRFKGSNDMETDAVETEELSDKSL